MEGSTPAAVCADARGWIALLWARPRNRWGWETLEPNDFFPMEPDRERSSAFGAARESGEIIGVSTPVVGALRATMRFPQGTSCGLMQRRHLIFVRLCAALIAVALVLVAARNGAAETWRDLVVAPEHRCAPYDRDDYPYPQSVERDIIARMGGRIYGPYTGRHFDSRRQTDIEHMVATSDAHDSGLCAAGASTRAAFARDVDNLTLAAPAVNRCGAGGKCAFDAGEWLPERNRCWFAARVVAVKRKYRLSVDRTERDALESVLRACASTRLVVYAPAGGTAAAAPRPSSADVDALAPWDDNGNGRITCAEARRHGIAPVPRGHPAYPYMHDGDGDGVVCE